jgi:hypothetical protein
MNSLRQAFSSKRKNTLMVLIQRLNSLIYWAISIRKLGFHSKHRHAFNLRLLQLYFLGCGSLEINGASGDGEGTHPSVAAQDQSWPWRYTWKGVS